MPCYFRKLFLLLFFVILHYSTFCWGFYAHRKINYYAVFLLPPQMLVLYKPNIEFISEHAIDPDKRRYAVPNEGPRHYIDLDHYGAYPFDSLPRKWTDALAKYGNDTLMAHGIVPWHIQFMLTRLTTAFKEKNFGKIMIASAEIGHYISDAHVPLHCSSNHNGQFTNQKGIHAFWESRVPELMADKGPEKDGFDFFIGKAVYIQNPGEFIWERILESAKAVDSVLIFEKQLSNHYPDDKKYAFEDRNGKIIRQYAAAYTIAYYKKLNGMIERRMRQSVFAIASFWYTAWVNAGQPDLKPLLNKKFSDHENLAFEQMNEKWKNSNKMIGREE